MKLQGSAFFPRQPPPDLLKIGSAASSGAITLPGLIWAILGTCLLIGLLKLVRVMA